MSEFAIARARHVAEFGTPGELCTWLIRACKEVDRLEAENAKLRAVVEAAKNASSEIDTFYLNVKQEDHVQTIEEDQHALWSARDAIDKALEKLETTNG